MKYSHIEWCDPTFNPWKGCCKVSPGCANCYAEHLLDVRFGLGLFGKGKPRQRTSEAYWRQPVTWNRLAAAGNFRECTECGRREFRKWDNTLPPGRLACCSTHGCLALPETDSNVVRPRVFCASLADWLDDEVPIKWLADLLQLIVQTPHLDWLLLTKRPQNWIPRVVEAADMMAGNNAYAYTEAQAIRNWTEGKPLPNVWILGSTENQQMLEKRICHLVSIPAVVHGLSCEPLLGPLDLTWIDLTGRARTRGYFAQHPREPMCHLNALTGKVTGPGEELGKISWVIAGGESGPHARPMHPEWARSLRNQCAAHGTAFLFKQWGEWEPFGRIQAPKSAIRLSPSATKHATKVWHNFTQPDAAPFCVADGDIVSLRVGKRKAGRLLDGVTHDGFPTVGASAT